MSDSDSDRMMKPPPNSPEKLHTLSQNMSKFAKDTRDHSHTPDHSPEDSEEKETETKEGKSKEGEEINEESWQEVMRKFDGKKERTRKRRGGYRHSVVERASFPVDVKGKKNEDEEEED
jgi:hypothetical protein